MKGILITFEGIEGSGKTTQIKRLQVRLKKAGFPALMSREPGGTPLGEKIRRLLLSSSNHPLAPRAELFLYLSSRAQHIAERLLPSLRSGKIVLCDRFSDATLAYQVYGRGLQQTLIKDTLKYAAHPVSPDLTLLLDLDARTGLSRVSGRGSSNRIDQESLEFHQRVRRGYLKLAKATPNRIKIINAKDRPDEVADSIQKIVGHLLARRHKKKGPIG